MRRLYLFLLLTASLVFCVVFGSIRVFADVKMASDITPQQFVNACANVCETARKKKYVYGDSRSAVPTADKKISCDRLIAKALWDLGFTDQETGGITVGSMIGYLEAHGFVRSNKLSDIKYGSIVIIKHTTVNYYSHTFVTLSFDKNTMVFDEYDCGSNTKIQSVQPLHCSWPSSWRTSPIVVFNIPKGSGSTAPASATPTPTPKPTYKVEMSDRLGEMVTGVTFSLSATVSPSSASTKKLVWSSTDTSIATVNSSGKVTTLTPGTVGIKASLPGTDAVGICTLTVLSEPVTKLTLKKSAVTIGVGASTSVSASISPSTAGYHKVTWKSSNSKVASVSPEGIITGLKAGTAKITAKAGDSETGIKKATCVVTVKEYPVRSIKLNKKKLSMKAGKQRTLRVTFQPSNASNRKVRWKSSNKKVAKVDQSGVVTALRKGKAVITATSSSGKKTASCTVTVK